MVPPVLCIHGGLTSEKKVEEQLDEFHCAMRRIAQAGYQFLSTHAALETAIHVTKLLEDDPLFNAGTGSTIQSDGIIRMSASLMDGATQHFSGVMNIENIQNPIAVAAALQSENDRVLAGTQALAYARTLGMPDYNPETPHRRREYEEKHAANKPTSTVGCVVLDASGHLAAVTSTGGKGWEIPGRVGDSPTIAGNFANGRCAVSATGCGEDIISVGMACALATRVADGLALSEAGTKSIAELKAQSGSAGCIALDRSGNIFTGATEPCLVWASANDAGIKLFGN